MSKILLISHIFPPAIDGGSRVIYKLSQQFEARGHDTLYLSSNCSSTDDFSKKHHFYSKDLTLQRSNVLKIPVYTFLRRPLKFINLFIPKKTYLHQLLKVFQKGPLFKFFPFVKATRKIIKFNPDIIVAGPLPTAIVLYAHFFKFLTNALTHQRSKVLINSSFHPTDQDFHQRPLIRSLQSADYLWALTKFESDYFVNNFNINRDKIILAGNGVDSDFLISNASTHQNSNALTFQHSNVLNILFIGTLSAHKRVDLLINSFSLLLKSKALTLQRSKALKLTIAGQKTLFYPKIKNICDLLEPKIKSQIKFVFSFPQKKLTKLIDNCTFLVLPSIQESFGLVLIEAWARGKPVIVSDIPSLSELVNQSHGGLIFEQDNQKDLQTKIAKLIKSPKLCSQYGQNGLKYVKTNYTWKKVSQKISQKLKLS